MYKSLLIFFVLLGIISLIYSILVNYYTTPKETIIYRYIPRTLEEEQMDPADPSDIFKSMFLDPTPYVETNDVDTRKREAINKFFISQL